MITERTKLILGGFVLSAFTWGIGIFGMYINKNNYEKYQYRTSVFFTIVGILGTLVCICSV